MSTDGPEAASAAWSLVASVAAAHNSTPYLETTRAGNPTTNCDRISTTDILLHRRHAP